MTREYLLSKLFYVKNLTFLEGHILPFPHDVCLFVV